MEDQDIDSKPVIKIEIKQEYEEYEEKHYISDAGCSYDTCLDPYSHGKIEVKDEAYDSHEELENSIKLEIKEELPIPGCTSVRKTFFCYHCERKFSSLQSLRPHVKCHLKSPNSNHLKKIKVKKKNIRRQCRYNRRNKCISNLNNHGRSHQKESTWLCKLCMYRTNTPGNLRKHVRAIHTDTFAYHHCDFCEFRTPILRELMSHVLKHEDVKLYQCLLCNFRAMKLIDLKIHERNNHNGRDNYACEICDFIGKTSSSLKLHISSKHQNKKVHGCQFCPFTTSRPGDLKRHMMSLHLALKLYHCKICNYRAVKAGDLNRHIMDRHSNNKPHECNLCSYKAKRAEHLRSHLLTHQGHPKFYFCELCNYKTSYKCALVRHVKTKHIRDENSFLCSLCDFWSLQLDIIKKHIHEEHF